MSYSLTIPADMEINAKNVQRAITSTLPFDMSRHLTIEIHALEKRTQEQLKVLLAGS